MSFLILKDKKDKLTKHFIPLSKISHIESYKSKDKEGYVQLKIFLSEGISYCKIPERELDKFSKILLKDPEGGYEVEWGVEDLQ